MEKTKLTQLVVNLSTFQTAGGVKEVGILVMREGKEPLPLDIVGVRASTLDPMRVIIVAEESKL